jgi:hypothetical protein
MALKLEKINLESLVPEAIENPLQSTMTEAVKVNPDTQIKLKKLSRDSGMPVEAVKTDPESVESSLNLGKINFDEMTKRSPNTAKYLTDFDNASIAHDDHEILSKLEDTIKIMPAAAAQAALGVSESLFRTPEFIDRYIGAASKSIEDITGLPRNLNPIRGLQDIAGFISEGRIPGTDVSVAGTTDVAEMISGATKQLAENPEVFPEAFQRLATKGQEADAALNDALEGDFAKLGGVLSDPEAWAGFLGQAAPSLYLAYASGGSLPFIAWLEAMDTAGGAAEFEKETGQKMTDAQFVQATAQSGLINAWFEKAGLDKILGAKSGKLGDVIGATLGEGGTEALQQINSNLSQMLGFNPEQSLTEGVLASAMGGAGAGGVVSGAIITTTKVVNATSARNERNQAQGNAEQNAIDSINENAEKSKLKERDKESFREFTQSINDNADVFIDGVQTSLYLQEKTDAEIQADPALVLLQKKADEAAALGVDVTVPVADFATDVVGTEHYDALREHMKLSPETSTPFRQEQEQTEQENYIKTMMDTASENVSEYAEAQDIFITVKDQLIDTGRMTSQQADMMAQVVPAWATVQALDRGIPVKQVYEESGLSVVGPLTGEAARLSPEKVLQQDKTDIELKAGLSEAVRNYNALRKSGAVKEAKKTRDHIQSIIDEKGLDAGIVFGVAPEKPTFEQRKVLDKVDQFGIFNIEELESRIESDTYVHDRLPQQIQEGLGYDTTRGRVEDTGVGAEAVQPVLDEGAPGERKQRIESSLETASTIARRSLRSVQPSESGGFPVAAGIKGRKQEAEAVRQAETDFLKRWAEQNDLIVSDFEQNLDTATQENNGVELGGRDNYVFLDESGTKWMKANRFTYSPTFSDLFDSIALHNYQFPNSEYTLEGFAEVKGEFLPVLSQDNIIEDEGVTSEQKLDAAVAELESLGYTRTDPSKPVQTSEFINDDIIVEDIHPGNVIISGGETFIFDPIIRLNPETKAQRVIGREAGSERQDIGEEDVDLEALGAVFEQAPTLPEISTETEAFKQWSGDGEVVEPEDVNDYDFRDGKPAVLKVFHGTTHDFSVFDALRGNLESQFGAVNYFTSSESDATDNYAGEGPDLTVRIENLKERLDDQFETFIDEYEGDPDELDVDLARSIDDQFDTDINPFDIPRVDDELDGDIDPFALSEMVARTVLSGGEQLTMELFVKVEKPFVIGENAEWLEFVDNEAIQQEAIEQVADNEGISVEDVEADRDNFEDQIDEARWDIENDTPHILVEAIQVVSDRHGVEAANLAGEIYDLGSEATPEDIEQLLRSSDDYVYAEGPEGELIQSQLIAEVIEEMGFDSIILRNAESRFKNMDIEGGTAHVHIFDSNKTNIKSVQNIGAFDPTDPDIFRQEAKGFYDPANSMIRLTESSDLSTFLHEFAHFMYDMELKNPDSVRTQKIHNWFKRNADAVAKEANGFVGKEGEPLEQKGALAEDEIADADGIVYNEDTGEVKTDTPAFKAWFGESKVVDESGNPLETHHGGIDADQIEIFDSNYGGQTTGNNEHGAFHFTDDVDVAEDYSRQAFIRRYEDRPEDAIEDGIIPEGITFDESLDIFDSKNEEIRSEFSLPSSPNEFINDLAERSISKQSVYLKIENPIELDMGGERVDVAQIEKLSKAIADQDFGVLIDEGFEDAVFGGELDKNDIEDNRAEIEERARENHGLEEDEEIENWQFNDAAREVLDESGLIEPPVIDGIIIKNMIDDIGDESNKMADQFIVFDPTNIKSINNIGTFGQFEESIFKQDGVPPTAPEGTGNITPEDVTAYLDNNTSGDTAKDAAIERAVHEQFVRGFETYLMEGKAPSMEMRNVFRSFARWLTQIYKAVRGDLKVNLDKEMREVFDRLLATEEQIAMAEARAQFEPMFTDAAMAGMNEEEFRKYQEQQAKPKDKATETLRDKLIKQVTRQTEKWWKEEKSDIVDEEIERLSKEKVYVAKDTLLTGTFKLDRPTVKAMVGEERVDKLKRKTIRIPEALKNMTAPGGEGVHPDEAAGFLGYNSGDEMIQALINAPNIKVKAAENAEQIMLDKHGDIMNDGTIEKEADDAVQNEERGNLILTELKALSKGTGRAVIERQMLKTMAEENIGKLSFRNIHPGKYRKAEIRAAQEAAAALATGNKEEAATAKARQALNFYLGKAATEAKNDTIKIVDRMARYKKKSVREAIMKAEGGYWEQLTKILTRFEFRKGATLGQVDRLNENIAVWAKARIEEDGDGLTLSPEILDEGYVTHWKNVPYDALQGVNDSVKNIEHVARYSNKITRQQEEMTFQKLVQKWTDSMNEKVKTRFKTQRTDVTEGKKWGRWAMAQMTKIPYMASWLDGQERAGISHDILVQPFTDAYNEELKLWGEVGSVVMDAIQGRSKEDLKRHNSKIYIPEIKDADNDGNIYGHQVLAVALNTGNESNLKKLLLGEGWANPDVEAEIFLTNPKLQAVLDHMTKSDWDMVQLIWDQMEVLYPQLAEVHRKTTGLTPPKIESTPVETEFGTFKGGYYPIKYDPNRSFRAQQNEDRLNAETESMFGRVGIQASVNASATNERTGYYAPIRLSLDIIPNHFQETIHYITHHDAVRETNKLIKNESVAATIKEKLGPEEYAQLRPWLNDIAKDGRETPLKMFWGSILQRLRFGTTLGVMGFKASTGIIQVLGLSNTIAEVGSGPVYQAIRSILGSTTTMQTAWDFAVDNSKVMAHRVNTMDRDIKSAMQKLEGKRGIFAAVQEASMKHIALMQTYIVDLPSWHAAYIKGMKDWGDEKRSYAYADWVIENIQGSGVTKDMAQIMRNQSQESRMFTMFMTFFSSLWNQERDIVKGAKAGTYSRTTVAAKLMFIFAVPVFLEMVLRGDFGDDDDDESNLQKYLTNLALYPVQSIPFVRDVASATVGTFGYNISPIAQIVESGTKSIPELITAPFTDEEITKGQVKGATKFIGAATGIPGINQAWSTGEHLYDVMVEGEDFTLNQLLYGPRR